MAKYRVWAKLTDWAYVDIEAETKDEAFEAAEELDGSEFHTTHGYGDWEMKREDVDELNADQDVDFIYEKGEFK